MVANVPGAHVIFNIVFFITIVSLVIQGTTVSWVARLLGLSTPLEKTGNDFGVELPEEIDSNLHDMTITQENAGAGRHPERHEPAQRHTGDDCKTWRMSTSFRTEH